MAPPDCALCGREMYPTINDSWWCDLCRTEEAKEDEPVDLDNWD